MRTEELKPDSRQDRGDGVERIPPLVMDLSDSTARGPIMDGNLDCGSTARGVEPVAPATGLVRE
jgi:hypothetical protein